MLLIFSLLFYTWGEEKLVYLLIVSSLVDFSCGILIESGKRKLGLIFSVVFNLSLLIYFKYLDFAFENLHDLFTSLGLQSAYFQELPSIVLPIGISFYTFQTMSYTIDVYNKRIKANRNLVDFATYVTMFPQLVAGPIVRYIDIEKNLTNRKITKIGVSEGIERFIIGLVKKVLIANTFGEIADGIFNSNLELLSTPFVWFGIIAYAIQIYFDFSGYSDMAIGMGRIIGFKFPENFNFPYIARSIQDFWRRWHISLSTWFRDYVYIPLGGNRKGGFRTYLNLFIVFFVTGLWHGASWNFITWGLYHGAFLVLERLGALKWINKLWKPVQHFYTLIIVLIGWVFFRSDTMEHALGFIWKMFIPTYGNVTLSDYLTVRFVNYHTLLFLIIALVFATPINGYIRKVFKQIKLYPVYQLVLIASYVLSVIYISSDSYNPFIYFRF